jgi:hypothetical protein
LIGETTNFFQGECDEAKKQDESAESHTEEKECEKQPPKVEGGKKVSHLILRETLEVRPGPNTAFQPVFHS